jgi:hypothetical protein
VSNESFEHADRNADNHAELMEMLGGIFVQLSRIYDVLLIESSNRDIISTRHEEGGLIAPPPILREDAWQDE